MNTPALNGLYWHNATVRDAMYLLSKQTTTKVLLFYGPLQKWIDPIEFRGIYSMTANDNLYNLYWYIATIKRCYDGINK